MTPLTIITEALRKIPPNVRFALLSIFAASVVGVGIAEIFVTIPGEVYRVQVYIGGYLGVQSASNVITKPRKGQDYAPA